MRSFPESGTAAANLLANRQEAGSRLGIPETAHTPPAAGHYPDVFLWDSCFFAIIYARHGGEEWLDRAESEINAVLDGQTETGFIPNKQITNNGRNFDPENIIFGRGAESSNYTQPPVLALAVGETYQAMKSELGAARAQEFLRSVYPRLAKFYRYFEDYRSNSAYDKLIGVIHPHETGRDSDPTFDFIKPLRIPRHGVETPNVIDKLNVPLDYLQILAHGVRLRRAQGDISKQREIFWVNDIMMNCIYADNLGEMSKLALELGYVDDAAEFGSLALTVGEQVLSKMWFPDARGGKGAFYALDGNKNAPILEVSISNLFPLTLPGLSKAQLNSLLDMMDQSFNNVNFPLPSVATDSPNYDPHNREVDRLWRGPTWINTNWYIVERGLLLQARNPNMGGPDSQEVRRCLAWAKKIADSSTTLVERNGPKEHYDPIKGIGQRLRVDNFGWSNLAYVICATALSNRFSANGRT